MTELLDHRYVVQGGSMSTCCFYVWDRQEQKAVAWWPLALNEADVDGFHRRAEMEARAKCAELNEAAP